MDTSQTSGPAVASATRDESDVLTRIRTEFGEMPGLRLTLRQAARLFDLEPVQCERVLRTLITRGELSTDGAAFVRSGTR